MHRLFYIKFYDTDGKFVVREDYSGLQFANQEITEKYIQHEKKMFETALDCKLKLNPHHKEVPDFSIKDLITAYCEVTGFSFGRITGKDRKRELSTVRMFITNTALDLGFVHGQLRPFFPNGVSYHYEKTFNDLIESGSITIQVWKAHEEKVMKMLGVLCSEDGGGDEL